MKKHYMNTASLVMAELCGNDMLVKEVEENISKTKLVSALEEIRVRKGMTQKDVATKMGISVSKVSRFEASEDADLRIGDVKAYMQAIGTEASVALFDKSMPTTNQIKHYVFEIERLLSQLTSIAKDCGDDPSIVDGISRFRGEVLYNFMLKYVLSGKDFPAMAAKDARRGNMDNVRSACETINNGMIMC